MEESMLQGATIQDSISKLVALGFTIATTPEVAAVLESGQPSGQERCVLCGQLASQFRLLAHARTAMGALFCGPCSEDDHKVREALRRQLNFHKQHMSLN